MPKHKRHHFVPQMYMRLFARPDENYVGVYVIDRGKFIPKAPIRGQAYRNYFYGKNPCVEKAFGAIEGRAAQIFADTVEHNRLPIPDSEEYEWLIFYLGIQHSRTMGAAEQHNERSEKLAKAMLRRKAELEGDRRILDALDKVRIRRTNAVAEVVRYTTIGASLLADLTFVLIRNESDALLIASDTPVVLHNRLYENQPISVIGYANIGLQLFLPLGPRLALFGYDASAYAIKGRESDVVSVDDPAQIRLLNDLQWEAAHAVLLGSPDTSPDQFSSNAAYWKLRRQSGRAVFCEEIVERSPREVRTRHGSGHIPSAITLDLEFVRTILPTPSTLGLYEIPPVRDQACIARVERALQAMEVWDAKRRAPI